MRKSELVDALADASGQDKTAVSAVLDALPGVVVDAMREHGSLTLPGLLKVEAKSKPARTMRNPATGAAIDKPASVAPAFKAVKSLKDQVAEFTPQL